MSLQTLAVVAVIWILVLATGWLVFLMCLRIRALRGRENLRNAQLNKILGMTSTDETDPDRAPMTDAEEAWRESVARRRAHFERETGTRIR